MTTGQKVKRLRKERDWTQSDLGARAGINFRNINRYESDRLKPGLKVLGKLAEAFDVPVDDLLEDGPYKANESQIKDEELFHFFQEVEKMAEEDRSAIKRLIQAMIVKHQVQGIGRLAS